MRMKKLWPALMLLSIALAGCASNQGHLGNRSVNDVKPFSVRRDANGNEILYKRFANDQMNEQNRKDGRRLNSNNIVGKHDNYSIRMNETVSKALASKFGYPETYVLLTDHNAYVAVGAGGKGQFKSQSAPVGRTRASYLNPAGIIGSGSNGNQLRTDGMYDARNNGIYDPRPNADGGRPNAGEANMYSASSDTYGAHSDSFGGTAAAGRGAYHAAGVEEEQLTESQKANIAGEVRKMKPSVEHVYISSKADFVNRLAAYASDEREGQTIQGYVAEFNALAERTFPYEPVQISESKGAQRPSHIYD